MRVAFYYYQHSPRIHISHVEEMDLVPTIGDTISLMNGEFYSLNKKIKEKNWQIKFKVIEREFRMIHRKSFYSDVNILLEPITIL
jgi:hypothetical protein